MMITKKVAFIAVLGLIISVILGVQTGANASKQEYVTIRDIYEETRGGWHQTYEAHGRTIVVDVDITVPEVDAVPIVRVEFPGSIEPYMVPDADAAPDIISPQPPIGITLIVKSSENSFFVEGTAFVIEEIGARAENSPLTPNEAKDFLLELVEKFEDQTGKIELELRGILAQTRRYKNIRKNGEYVGADMNTPVSDMGTYEIEYFQTFYHIPYLLNGYFRINAPGDNHHRPSGKILGSIASKTDYMIDYYPAIETEVCADDLPLVPFSQAKAAFEEWINAGLIQSVYEVRFGYMIYDDPQNKKESFLLLPVWQLRGDVVQAARFSLPPLESGALLKEKTFGVWSAVVEAQTGKFLDMHEDRRINRQDADHIILWEDVK